MILGVFSPYISNLSESYNDQHWIIILGEAYETTLRTLQKRCQELCPQLQITVKKSSYLKPTHLSEYLPPWAFDFDQSFYSDRLQVEERYQTLNAEDIPLFHELELLEVHPLAFALSASLSFPSHWGKELSHSRIRFAEILNFLVGGNEKHVTLSQIFLTVLTHFLENCLSPDPSFSPKMYKEILFTDSFGTMGVYDPLSFIESICNILESIWNTCREELLNFDYFKFDSRGLLQGKDCNTQVYKTIFAYCGGWKRDQRGNIIAACGNEPLFVGHHRTCPVCQKLICNECGFCSPNCQS